MEEMLHFKSNRDVLLQSIGLALSFDVRQARMFNVQHMESYTTVGNEAVVSCIRQVYAP